jgi:hypothetical protein
MPTISTQTDECVDVIDCLNQEFDVLQDENFQLKLELKETREQGARDYWIATAPWKHRVDARRYYHYHSALMDELKSASRGFDHHGIIVIFWTLANRGAEYDSDGGLLLEDSEEDY